MQKPNDTVPIAGTICNIAALRLGPVSAHLYLSLRMIFRDLKSSQSSFQSRYVPSIFLTFDDCLVVLVLCCR